MPRSAEEVPPQVSNELRRLAHGDVEPPTNRRLILRDHNFVPPSTQVELDLTRVLRHSHIAPYDGFSTEGMTYNSHFFIRIATFEMTCVALPLFV